MKRLVDPLIEKYLKIFGGICIEGNEIDAVIELKDGNWCAFEIKLGINKAEKGAKNLIKVCENIVNSWGKTPLIKCVICGVGNDVYKNNDGVYIFPITVLKN